MLEACSHCGVFFKFKGWAVSSPGLLLLAARVVRSYRDVWNRCKRGVLCALALIGVIIEKAKNMRNEPS